MGRIDIRDVMEYTVLPHYYLSPTTCFKINNFGKTLYMHPADAVIWNRMKKTRLLRIMYE